MSTVCSVCSRLTGFSDEDTFAPPVNLARCPAPGGMECRAVTLAVTPFRREMARLDAEVEQLSKDRYSEAARAGRLEAALRGARELAIKAAALLVLAAYCEGLSEADSETLKLQAIVVSHAAQPPGSP